jgi:methanogenic corrinoid protein MtbC1
MSLSENPTFNLRAVLRETGLNADTLRAWERRYGLPKPRRSPGGHRLYSERDIHLLKWLKERQGEGFTISRAVSHWNELIESGVDPLAERPLGPAPASSAELSGNAGLQVIKDKWIAACMKFDEGAAELGLNEAFAMYPTETVLLEILLPALKEIGEQWQQGSASIAQEHFATALVTRRLEALIASAPAPMQPGVVMLACPESEIHTLPILALGLLLRRRGLKVVYLGANVPSGQLEAAAASVKPALVILSAQRLVSAASLHQTAAVLAAHRIPVGFGGPVFSALPALRAQIAGFFIGDSLLAAVSSIERMILQGPVVRRPGKPLENLQAQAFHRARARIEMAAQLPQDSAQDPALSTWVTAAHVLLGGAIAAALEFGDIRFIDMETAGLLASLRSHGMSASEIHAYLLAYAGAVRREMGPLAAAIVEWLSALAAGITTGLH